ncbi:hypothetical protein Tco_0403468 [Tanacetum coccineum]
MLTRAMAKELGAASAHECLFVDFLSEEEPKKVSGALHHPDTPDSTILDATWTGKSISVACQLLGAKRHGYTVSSLMDTAYW